jgi:hypothetical protein
MGNQTYSISRRCSEVTVDEFIDCVCSGNLKRLVRGAGEPTKGELEEAFQELYAEYSSLTGSSSYSYMLGLTRRCVRLEARLQAAAIALRNGDSGLLQSLGYKGSVEQAMNGDMMELEVARRELAKVRDGGSDERVERKDFMRWVGAVSKFMGYRIDIRRTKLDELLTCSSMAREAAKRG